MLHSWSKTLCKRVLNKVLGRACEAPIPRSGEEGAAVNCFSTRIDRGNEPYLLALSIEGETVNCIEWNGDRYTIETSISLSNISGKDIKITHYYGLSTIYFDGIWDFSFNRLFPWPYIKIHVVRRISAVDQYFFNKKKLITKQRTDLLKFLIAQAMEGRTEHSPLDLMTELHTMKWFLHPQGDEAQRQLEFYLESLVDTGELRKVNYRYILTGQALRAVEDAEEQDRKHTENVKMQRRTFWLTLVIAALTVIQANLVKLPVLFDLSNK